jgi:hypothetical protein
MDFIHLYVPMMGYGKERRNFIKELFDANPGCRYCVNAQHRPQVKADPDLKKLIRMGFLKQIRSHDHRCHAKTYLVKV